MSDQERNSASPNLEIETAKSDKVLISALMHLGTLRELDFTNVESSLRNPLMKLFGDSQDRMKLGGRDRDLQSKIRIFWKNNPYTSEWISNTDLKHTVASFDYLAEIAKREGFTPQEQKIVLSAMVVHDCAYPKTDNFAAFARPDTRLSHMLDGENEFLGFAKEINEEFPGFYSPDEIEVICSIIRQHDNPSIRNDDKTLQFSYDPPPRKLMWAHRDADRLWMLDRGGFALDLIRRVLESNPWYNPPKYLEHVISRHLEEADKYEDNGNCISYQGVKSLYRTAIGFEIFQRLIKERTDEYSICSSSP